MAGERVNGMVSRLLDEAGQAARSGDWNIVEERARAALRLNPNDPDAKAFAEAAERQEAVVGDVQGPSRQASSWLSGAMGLLAIVAWLMGAFDVFFVQNGLGFFAAHDCYSNILGKVWCDGPWSTSPLPDDVIMTPDGFLLP